ncbi:MAG: RNA-binding transcriptional accessory protein, partial [Thiomargarita sp.]|nr:RNA-binding transcriptional accessory protein [Thiomargarita sp.]
MKTIAQRIAEELSVPEHKVQAAIILLDEGATVPFIARYRKEVTGGLDDIQLRTLEDRLRYIRELDERREVILTSIRGQNKLTTELEVAINDTITKTNLEDLYLPYRLKRRSSKAQTAKDAGLEPLALDLLEN